MMTRSSRNIILFIFLMLFGLYNIKPALADETDHAQSPCTMEQQEKIREELIKDLQSAFDAFKSKVTSFNPLAKDFLKSCYGLDKNPQQPLRPSLDDAATAKMAGVDIEDDSLYEYLGSQWGQMRGDTSECVQKLKKVKEAYMPANSAFSQLKKAIQALKQGSSRCSCDPDGAHIVCDTLDQNTGEVKGESDHCESFTGVQQKLADCPLCGVFEAALGASAQIAHIAWEKTAEPLSKTVAIFFLAILAFESLKAVSSVSGLKVGSYLKSVLLIGLKIAITVLLLSNSQYIYALFISPVIKGGLDMGMAIASAGGNVTCDASTSFSSVPSAELDESLFNHVLSTVRCFGAAAATLPAVGMGLVCHSAPEGIWSGDILPDLYMFFSGLIMIGFGIMIWLALSFYLIDCTVQIGMLCALVPLLIACWPFEMTKQYTTKGVKMLMNTFFNFTMMGTVLLLGTEIISFAVMGNGEMSMQELIGAINNNDAEKLKRLASLDGMRVLMLLACSIFALKLITKASSLANQFSQGSGADTGSKMGGAAMGVLTQAGLGSMHSAGRLAGSFGNAALEKTGVKAGFNNLTNSALGARRNFFNTVGQKLGLGQYINKQTGSGLNTAGAAGVAGAAGAAGAGGGRRVTPGSGGSGPEQQGFENEEELLNDTDLQEENEDILDENTAPENEDATGEEGAEKRPNRGVNSSESGRQQYENRGKAEKQKTLKDVRRENRRQNIAASGDNGSATPSDGEMTIPDNQEQPQTAELENPPAQPENPTGAPENTPAETSENPLQPQQSAAVNNEKTADEETVEEEDTEINDNEADETEDNNETTEDDSDALTENDNQGNEKPDKADDASSKNKTPKNGVKPNPKKPVSPKPGDS